MLDVINVYVTYIKPKGLLTISFFYSSDLFHKILRKILFYNRKSDIGKEMECLEKNKLSKKSLHLNPTSF